MKRRNWQEFKIPKKEKVDLLQNIEWLSEFSPVELNALADRMFPCKMAAGEPVYQEGDEEAFMCIVISGKLRILKNTGSPSQLTLATLGPGEPLGEMAIVDKAPRSASAVALTDCSLFVLSSLNLQEMTIETPQLWNKLLLSIVALLSGRLRANYSLMGDGVT